MNTLSFFLTFSTTTTNLSHLRQKKCAIISVTVIGTSDTTCSKFATRTTIATKFATFFELDALPIATEMGMWDFILSQPTEFILTQSMIFMQSLKAQKMIDRQTNFIESSDNAEHELEELQAARDYVASGAVSFGDYHASLVPSLVIHQTK
ncbi:hypothetical protein PWW31_18525 [Vibrio harveyi]|nr:hypothetical protein PWW31_18525 [Vibrio harveyi]